MKTHLVSLIILGSALYACNTPESKNADETTNTETVEETEDPNEGIVGQWSNIAMKVEIKGALSDSTIDVPAGKWEEVLNIKPILTTFREDGTLSSEYKNLDGDVIMTRGGTWEMRGDTLWITQDSITNKYATRIDGGMVEFSGYLDWDDDGEADDHYWGKQERIK